MKVAFKFDVTLSPLLFKILELVATVTPTQNI